MASTLKFTSGTTTTVDTFSVNGTIGDLITIESTTPTAVHYLVATTILVPNSYLDISDSNASPDANWTADGTCVDSGNNVGWFTSIQTITLDDPGVATATTSSPLLVATVATSVASATATATPPSINLNVLLDVVAATSTAISPDIIVVQSLDVASATATTHDIIINNSIAIAPGSVAVSTATSPELHYNIIPTVAISYATAISPSLIVTIALNVSDTAAATATTPSLDQVVVLDSPTSFATVDVGVVSILPSVSTSVAISYATANNPLLIATTSLGVASANATTEDIKLQLGVVLDTPVASAYAYAGTAINNVVIEVASSTATAVSPTLLSSIVVETITVSPATTINFSLDQNIILTSTSVASSFAIDPFIVRAAETRYIDPVNGSDLNSGTTWLAAWQTMTSGSLTGSLVPGDLVKFAKSNDPINVGLWTWTSGSKILTIDSERAKMIDDCESGWIAVSGSSVSHPTFNSKHGNSNVKISTTLYASGTLYAYKQLPSVTDYSAYQAITMWYRVESNVVGDSKWKMCLCSDVSGSIIVDQFMLPAHPATDRWMPINVVRDGGGNLGSSIGSISLFTTTDVPSSSHDVLFDNILASKTNDLNLTSFVSKNGLASGGTEGYWGIQSISGTIVLLDRDTNCSSSSGRGYYGTTETVTSYIRDSYVYSPAISLLSSTMFNVNESGDSSNQITFSGGWNTLSDVQDGETFFDGQNGLGLGLNSQSRSFISIDSLNFFRFGRGYNSSGESFGWNVNMQNVSNCSDSALALNEQFLMNTVEIGNVNSNGSPDIVGSNGLSMIGGSMDNTLLIRRALSNNSCGVYLESTNHNRLIGSSSLANNDCGIRVVNCGNGIFVEDTTFDNISVNTSNDCSRLTLVNTLMSASIPRFEHLSTHGHSQKTISHNHNSTGENIISHSGGLIRSMTSTRPGRTGLMWKLLTSEIYRNSFDPLPLYVGQVYCTANIATTVKAWLKKDHSTSVNGKLAVRGRQLAGITNDVTSALSNNTSWQEISISFTPTESGVVQVEVWAEYVSSPVHNAVYYDQGLTVL